MRDLISWLNEVVENPNHFTIVDSGKQNSSGRTIYIITPEPGETIQEGTPIDDDNLNSMDQAGWEALQTAKFVANLERQTRDHVDAIEGEVIRVNLTNTQKYPFNNSEKTITLAKRRNKTNYTVLVEVISSTGGGVGDIRITDRVDNAFKISYSGAATAVTVDCYVQGGY